MIMVKVFSEVVISTGAGTIAALATGIPMVATGVIDQSSLIPIGCAVGVSVTIATAAWFFGKTYQKWIDDVRRLSERISKLEKKDHDRK